MGKIMLDTRKDLLKYLKYPEQASNYTLYSAKKIELICPDCGKEKEMVVQNLTRRGFSCVNCSDGISTPEKFCRELLNQLIKQEQLEDYITQYKIEDKKYDFYFIKEGKSCVIEVNGIQHYEGGFNNSLVKEQENDRYKEHLAKENSINNYIVVDCRYSDFNYLRENFTKELCTYFNLDDVEWIKINEFCLTSNMTKAIDLWNSGINNMIEIGDMLKLERHTIIRYLKRGNESGLCNYNPQEQIELKVLRQSKAIVQILDGVVIGEYPSARAAERITGIPQGNISACVRGERKIVRGYSWMHKENVSL